MISKTLSTSQKYAALGTRVPPFAEFCQALYPLLVAHSDDFGRLQGDSFTVKHQCHPTSPRSLDDFTSALRALHDVELIAWYSVGGRFFIQINNFESHQSGLHKRTRSQFPRVPGACSGNDPEFPYQEKGREEKRRELKKNVSAELNSAPVALTFPVIGPDGPTWQLSEAQVAEWATLFPGLNILAEAKKALAWVQASLGRRKTARGMLRFLVGWFGRAVDSGRGSTTAPRHDGVQGGSVCAHEPQCATRTACIALTIEDGRRQRARASA